MILFLTVPTTTGEIIINSQNIILEKKEVKGQDPQYFVIINPRDSRSITQQTYTKIRSNLITIAAKKEPVTIQTKTQIRKTPNRLRTR